MTEKRSARAEFSPERIAEEMAEHVEALGRQGRSVKEAIRLAARRTGLTFNQAKRLRYREWAVIPAHVADRVREARSRMDGEIANAARRQRHGVEDRLARLEATVFRNSERSGVGNTPQRQAPVGLDSAVDR